LETCETTPPNFASLDEASKTNKPPTAKNKIDNCIIFFIFFSLFHSSAKQEEKTEKIINLTLSPPCLQLAADYFPIPSTPFHFLL